MPPTKLNPRTCQHWMVVERWVWSMRYYRCIDCDGLLLPARGRGEGGDDGG